uniref:Uncharacterized protein n=1 Tax=Arundo donax TaxID=35708 RepID=A0A0A8Z101_ARUDO
MVMVQNQRNTSEIKINNGYNIRKFKCPVGMSRVHHTGI